MSLIISNLKIEPFKVNFSGNTIKNYSNKHNASQTLVFSDKLYNTDVSFTGLTAAISSKLFESVSNIQDLVNKYPKSNGIAGTWPASWIDEIPSKQRKKAIKKFYKSLGKIAQVLRTDSFSAGKYKYDKDSMVKDFAPKIRKAHLILNTTFKEAGIIKPNETISFELLGMGFHGTVFKFIVNNKPYVLKVYHDTGDTKITSKDYHGTQIETNRAMYINKISSESQYCKFYFADIQNGFMILDFIDAKNTQPPKLIKDNHIGIYYGDCEEDKALENIISHYIVDYGGIVIENPILATNKTARWVCKKVCTSKSDADMFSKWNIFFNKASENIIPNSQDVLLGLYSIIKLLPQDDQSTALNNLLNLNNPKLTEIFADNIILLPDELKSTVFNKVIRNLNPQKQVKLIKSLTLLPEQEQISTLNKIIAQVKSENQVISPLIKDLISIDNNFTLDVIALIGNEANVFVEELLDKIPEYPKHEQLRVYLLLAKNANRQIQGRLFYSLGKIPTNMQPQIITTLKANADKQLKERIDKDLYNIIKPFNKVA